MTAADVPAFVPQLLAFGFLGVFAVALVEKLVPVIPSIGVYLLIGALSGREPWMLAPFIVLTACGSTIGSLCWFLVVRHTSAQGRLAGLARRLGHDGSRRSDTTFHLPRRKGFAVVAVQVVPVVRFYSSLAFGAGGMAAYRFALATFLGCLIWNCALIAAGAALVSTIGAGL